MHFQRLRNDCLMNSEASQYLCENFDTLNRNEKMYYLRPYKTKMAKKFDKKFLESFSVP